MYHQHYQLSLQLLLLLLGLSQLPSRHFVGRKSHRDLHMLQHILSTLHAAFIKSQGIQQYLQFHRQCLHLPKKAKSSWGSLGSTLNLLSLWKECLKRSNIRFKNISTLFRRFPQLSIKLVFAGARLMNIFFRHG